MKKSFLTLSSILLSLAMLLCSCGGSGSASASNEQSPGATVSDTNASDNNAAEPATGNKEITVIVMALNSDYWHLVEAGAKLAGQEFGYNVSVIGPNAESDAVNQMNMIEDAVANKTGAIVLAPTEPQAVIPSVQKAKDAGIPMIIIDQNLATDDTSLRKSFIGTGNYDAGKIAGEYLASKLQPGDQVAIIRGLVGQPIHDERTNGAQEALEAAGMEVVSVQPADSDRGKAVNVAENILQTNPDIKCFYATNDEMALGAYQAIEGVQKQDQIITMGFDGSFGALDSIKEGKLTASLAQKPIEEGYLGVKSAIDVLEGRDVEDTVNNGVVVVDQDNVDEFRAEIDAKVAEVK